MECVINNLGTIVVVVVVVVGLMYKLDLLLKDVLDFDMNVID